MDSKSFVDTNSLQTILLCVKKFARNIALMLLLISFLIPISHQVINTQAQDTNHVNLNAQVEVEIVKNDNTQIIKQTTLHELQTDSDLVNINKFDQNELDKVELKLTPEVIKEIEAKQGIVYEGEVAVTNHSVLSSLGYTAKQIELIQNMADFYNSQTVKKVKITIDDLNVSERQISFFTIQAQAACTPKAETTWEWWGSRTVLDGCGVNQYKWNYGQLAAIIGLASFSPCSFLCGLVSTNQAAIVGALEYENNRCEGKGAILTLLYIGVWKVESVC
jgi:hypothetical protein